LGHTVDLVAAGHCLGSLPRIHSIQNAKRLIESLAVMLDAFDRNSPITAHQIGFSRSTIPRMIARFRRENQPDWVYGRDKWR
jgi:hypothetical protein